MEAGGLPLIQGGSSMQQLNQNRNMQFQQPGGMNNQFDRDDEDGRNDSFGNRLNQGDPIEEQNDGNQEAYIGQREDS